mgnify:CR=1 FL=1
MEFDGIEVYDDFLPEVDFNILKNTITGNNFPWYYNPNVAAPVGVDDGLFQYYHMFYENRLGRSDWYHLIESMLNRLDGYKLHRAKLNSRPTSSWFKRRSTYHIDYADMVTAIFYINTNNGYTHFKKSGRKVKSIANRVVVFNSNFEHMGVACTNEKRRLVLNINYVLPPGIKVPRIRPSQS